MKIAIIINKHRLTEDLSNRLASSEFTDKYDITYDLFTVDNEDIATVVKNLNTQAYNAIVVGGGDGTVRSVIQGILEYDIPLIILPLGSFNMLAATLGYTADIDTMFGLIKNNKTKQIDLVDVNGIISINHAWIGFYYDILKIREKHKDFLGTNKLFKAIFNFMNLFKQFTVYELQLNVDGRMQKYKTCIVYVGNNETKTNWLNFMERKSLSTGLLSVDVVRCKNRWDLFLCMVSTLFGRFKNSRFVTEFSTDKLTVNSKKHIVEIVIDGDLFKLKSPIHFTNLQKKLTVIIP